MQQIKDENLARAGLVDLRDVADGVDVTGVAPALPPATRKSPGSRR